MQVVILCGGLGTRLGPLVQNTPKSLIDIEGFPFLDYQMRLLSNAGLNEVLFCVGKLGQKIISYLDSSWKDMNVSFSKEFGELLGTGGALVNAKDKLRDDFLVIYGDSYLDVNYNKIISYYKKNNYDSLMTVYKNQNRFDKSNVVFDGKLVKKYGKNMRHESPIYIDYGINIFKKEIIIENIAPDTFYNLSDLQSELAFKGRLLGYEVKDRFYHIGDLEALKSFRNFIREKNDNN